MLNTPNAFPSATTSAAYARLCLRVNLGKLHTVCSVSHCVQAKSAGLITRSQQVGQTTMPLSAQAIESCKAFIGLVLTCS